MNIKQNGRDNYLTKKFSCGETIVKTIQESGKLKISDDLVRASSAFKAGFGCKGDVCGCFLAAATLIGLKHGRISGKEDDILVCKKTAEFYDKFQEKFKALQCKNITKKFRDKDVFVSKERKEFCANIIEFTLEKLEKELAD